MSIAELPYLRRIYAGLSCAVIAMSCAHRVAADGVENRLIEHSLQDASGAITADELNPARIYRTREERREAGLKRRITPWLTVSGLAEAEFSYDEFTIGRGGGSDSARSDSATLQLGLLVDPLEFAQAELLLEYDTDSDELEADEAFITLERDPWELSAGRQYTPFGVYYSNFVSDPLIEFGETRADHVFTLDYGPSDELDLSLTLYRGEARRLGRDSGQWDWVFALGTWFNRSWSAGLSYQSDLADADSRLLRETHNRYSRRVTGLSGYLLWVGERHEATLEVLAATRSFEELDRDRNQPWAWNVEVVRFFPDQNLELAFRLEGSHELEDTPRYRYGTAMTWRIGKYVNLTLEYLRSEFKDGLAHNDNDEPYKHVDHVASQLSIEF